MTPRPSEEQLDLLDRMERFSFELADFWNRRMRWQAELWNTTVMVGLTWLSVKRRLNSSGLEHIRGLDWERGVCLVANHRTFYDFFTICSRLNEESCFPAGRIMFPVRSTFFYDHPAGPIVNMLMSGMVMFPPILRDRDRKEWNTYALDRCISDLQDNAAVIGIHPEGSRSRADDMFEVGKGRVGAAVIALEARDAQIVPVFLAGITNDLLEEIRRNWFEPENYPVYLAFGPEVEFCDLQAATNDLGASRKATNRCMEAIRVLAEQCRREAAEERVTAEA
ncbi:MAG TPA: lysophospholipid acyltransferase family protein [Myxococcota bacterium]|nr:lysophospholipid acyltransferase family protein [Myxococcota bacterium]